MASKARTPEDWISFLLTCMDYTAAKPDWQRIAEDTGAYKAGKFVNQAYANLRKKYEPLPTIDGAAGVPATPKSTKKRAAAAADLGEDDEEKPKRSRKAKTPKKAEPKEELKEETDGQALNVIKVDSSADELNDDVTVNGDGDGGKD